MARFLFIEKDPKWIELFTEKINSFATDAKIDVFDSFASFNTDFTKSVEQQNYDLCLFDIGALDQANWRIALAWCEQNLQCPIVLTSYESSALNLRFLSEFPKVYNVLFKPFDPLLLKETLFLATQSQKLTQGLEIKSSAAFAKLGVLKGIPLQSISEIGFVTLSEVAFPVLSLSKYLTNIFDPLSKTTLWAQCFVSLEHPKKPGTFINKFQFFALPTPPLNSIRRYLNKHSQDEISNALWDLGGSNTKHTIKAALITPHRDQADVLKKNLEEFFKNLEVEMIRLEQDTIFGHDLVINFSELNPQQIKKHFKPQTPCVLISETQIPEDNIKKLSESYQDIFQFPLDRPYLYKKLKIHVPTLIPKENFELINISCHEKLKAVNTVEVREVSEVFLTFDYHRRLNFRDVREFIFLNEANQQMIEIPAFCHYSSEKPDDKGRFRHQFVFFGMTDLFLKEIRLWLLHNHIMQKAPS